MKPRTFEGTMLEWIDNITENRMQMKVRGLSIWDMKKLKRLLIKNKIIKMECD